MKTLVKIYKQAKPYWGYILLGIVAILAINAASIAAPGLMQSMIRLLQDSSATLSSMDYLWGLAIWLLVVYAFQSVMRFLNSYYCHVGAWKFVSDIRVKLYDHLQRLSLSYFSDKQTGQLLSRIMSDTSTLETLIAHAIPELIGSLTLFTGVTIILFRINWQLALLTCVPIPFILIFAPILRRMRRKHKEAQAKLAALSGVLQDNLSGIKEIQIFNKQDSENKKVKEFSQNQTKTLLNALIYSAMFHPTISFFTSLGNVIVVLFGGYMALKYRVMEIDQLFAFFMYLGMFYGPVGSFARIIDDMQAGIAGSERILEVLETRSEIQEKPDAIDVGMLTGRIELDNVSFAYKNGVPVLADISFEVPARKMVAIVGATGVGKSTLVSLLPRFYDVERGSIKIDGTDIRDMTLESLRSNISVVLQDVFLFNGTIRENIMYGNQQATNEQLEQATKMACIYDFIAGLPEGFETMVGERGMRLSGGQKQRMSIARAILRKSPVLVMDEATSAVDTETESQIRAAIAAITGHCTMVVIAHRLSTVRSADHIIVLEDCRVAETGTHEQLIAKNGIYKNLVDMQNIVE